MSGFIIELDRPWQFFQFNCFADWFCSPFAFYKSCKTNVYKTVACEFYGVLFSLYLLKILLSTDQRLQQVNWTECPSDLHPAIFRKHVRILYDPCKLFSYFIHFVVKVIFALKFIIRMHCILTIRVTKQIPMKCIPCVEYFSWQLAQKLLWHCLMLSVPGYFLWCSLVLVCRSLRSKQRQW